MKIWVHYLKYLLLNDKNKRLTIGRDVLLSIQWVSYTKKEQPFEILFSVSNLFFSSYHILDENEYFYKRSSHEIRNQQTQSSSSSLGTNEARIGEMDEFEKMNQYYQAKHTKNLSFKRN